MPDYVSCDQKTFAWTYLKKRPVSEEITVHCHYNDKYKNYEVKIGKIYKKCVQSKHKFYCIK